MRQYQALPIEEFETRRLLSVASSVDTLGVLAVVSNAADPIAIGRRGADVTVNGTDPDTGAFPSNEVTAISAQGGPGDNQIDFRAFDIVQFPALGTLTIDGGGGHDILLGPQASTTYSVIGPDQGVLGGPAFGSVDIGTFGSISSLVGGPSADTFAFGAGASLSGTIAGGGGADTLDLSGLSGPQSVHLTGSNEQGFGGTATPVSGGFDQIASLLGCLDGGTLTGENAASTWNLEGAPTYSDGVHTLAFQQFPNLQGGNAGNVFDIIGDAVGQVTANLIGGGGNDLYRFHGSAQLVGNIEGLAGFDTLSYADFASAVAVRLTGSDATGYQGTEDSSISGGGFGGIDSISASPPENGPSSLSGENVNSVWSLGQALTYTDGSGTPLAFRNFGELQGGTQADTFNITTDITADISGGAGDDTFVFGVDGARVAGSIDGQDGRNMLDLAGYRQPTRVDLAAETASMVEGRLAHIQDVRGGTGDDTIIGDAGDNVLIGNGGSDLLEGGPGNDTYGLALNPGDIVQINDDQGLNTLDFSASTVGVTVDPGAATLQSIAPFRQLLLSGQFATVVGSRFADVFLVSASPLARDIVGGPEGSDPGDVLQVDAGGRVATTTSSAVLVEGMGIIRYARIGRVNLLNQLSANIVVGQSHDPEPAQVGQNVAMALSVANRGPSTATQVVVTDVLPAGFSLISAVASQGEVLITGGTLTVDLGSLLAGGVATTQVTLRAQAVGVWVNTALVTAHEPNPNPDDARSSQAISVVEIGPLRLISQHRYGSGYAPTSIVLSFNESLDAATAVALNHYVIISSGRDGKIGTRDDRRIRIKRVIYNAASRTITLLPTVRLPLTRVFFISVRGILGTEGSLLDGAGSGRPGSPYRALFHGYSRVRHLVRPRTSQAIPRPARSSASRTAHPLTLRQASADEFMRGLGGALGSARVSSYHLKLVPALTSLTPTSKLPA